MKFEEFERKVEEVVQEAKKSLTPTDATVHLRKSPNGEISVVCGFVSPEYASPGVVYSRHCFTIKDYVKGKVDLHESFHYMMQDIEEEVHA